MKIVETFRRLFQTKSVPPKKREIPPCPISYNRNDVTREEFKAYIHWLSENNISRTFIEPDRFVTEAERKERNEFKQYIKYLSENNINKTFWC